MYRSHVLVCGGTRLYLLRKPADYGNLKERDQKAGLEKEVSVVRPDATVSAPWGPIMIVYPDASFYSMVKVEDHS